MQLKRLELTGFKSFAKKHTLDFVSSVTSVVGPNGSGKSNVVEAIRFVLGEQSTKSLRSKSGSDLIFKGSKNLEQLSRAKVEIVFDNRDRAFSFQNTDEKRVALDFDEVRIAREVFRDGANKYSINGTEVRLKDITEMLASVHIGASGHHIISQGEADRILSASPKERKNMIEDALGLRVYQLRMKESERKLEKTKSNLKEVTALRRELAPHLTFLKRQVEKIEKAKNIRDELEQKTIEYYAQEKYFIKTEKELVQKQIHDNEQLLAEIEKELSGSKIESAPKFDTNELDALRLDLRNKESAKNQLSQSVARIEGMVSIFSSNDDNAPKFVKLDVLQEEFRIIESVLEMFKNAKTNEVDAYINRIKGILNKIINVKEVDQDQAEKVLKLENEKRELLVQLNELVISIREINEKITSIENEIKEANRSVQNKESNLRSLLEREGSLKTQIALLNRDKDSINIREEAIKPFEDEMAILLGPQVIHKARAQEVQGHISKGAHIENRRQLERLKIKLEELGGSGDTDVVKEFEETRERDEFLAKEVIDIEESISNLSNLIVNLREEMETMFKEGVERINKVFQDFFSAMFGGGNAFLSIVTDHKKRDDDSQADSVDDEYTVELGIDINVNLPHKKVRELHMLSGGERSLTSIALLFSMSQVTPPPFLVLDETDAALDEANSRRYGDMIERLAKLSQLVVVTHNRETMSRAGVLYGVTIGADGSSKLLSVKFDEATQYAK